MKFWTYGEIKKKVLRDLDMEGETFVTADEMLGYANEAIDEVERQIHLLCEDYFISRSIISLVSGQEEYDVPSDIFALKIRQMIYRCGNEVFKLKRLREWNKFSIYETEKGNLSSNKQYGYMVLNGSPCYPKILLTPTPAESGSYLHVWYIRNANTIVDESSVCDIPEAVGYVISYMKMKCMEKELHPNLSFIVQDVERQKMETINSLSEMFPDNETEIEPDYRLYNEMTGGNY